MTDAPTAPRAWQRMLSGRRLDLLAPQPDDIAIEDIAHGLARVARWNGQTTGDHAFSVAQHCLIVEAIVGTTPPEASRELRLAALLHDSPEYVIGDLISPFKAAIGLDYKAFEQRLLGAIHRRFGLSAALGKDELTRIKQADRIAAYFEATRLAGFAEAEAVTFFGKPERLPQALASELGRITAEAPAVAQARYLDRFHSLASSG